MQSRSVSDASLLIDDEGRVWDADSAELRKRLFWMSRSDDLARNTICELGFIGFRRCASDVQVRLSATRLAPCALATALYLLAETKTADWVAIEFVDDDRAPEIVAFGEVIDRLTAISDCAELAQRVQAHDRDVAGLAEQSPLRRLFEHWHRNAGRCNPLHLEQIADDTVGGRFLVVSRLSTSRFVIEDCGDGFRAPDARWVRSARGKHLDEQHDVIYFRWVLSEYHRTLTTGRPKLTDIDARLLWPGIGAHHVRHRRLLLPCTSADGSRYLFLANGTLPDVGDRCLESETG